MNNEKSEVNKFKMEFIKATHLDKALRIMAEILNKLIDIFKN